jgi:hypothetical protein
MPTLDEFSFWFDNGIEQKADFMIMVCDTFDWGDYPVYIKKENFWEEYHKHNGINMQTIMEVYDLHLNKDIQLKEHRAFHYPPKE